MDEGDGQKYRTLLDRIYLQPPSTFSAQQEYQNDGQNLHEVCADARQFHKDVGFETVGCSLSLISDSEAEQRNESKTNLFRGR